MNEVQSEKSMTFTVVKKNQEIEFNSYFSEIDDVRSHLEEFLNNNSFVQSLLSSKNPSAKQIAWMHYLATENVKTLDKEEEDEGIYSNLVSKMYDGVKSKTRKFHLRLPGEVSISTVNNGQNVGCVYVYENGNYVGKITASGHLMGNVSEDTRNLLEDANENLLALAKMFGHETGNCSVCGRTLSDKISLQLGIGPVCLKRLEC